MAFDTYPWAVLLVNSRNSQQQTFVVRALGGATLACLGTVALAAFARHWRAALGICFSWPQSDPLVKKAHGRPAQEPRTAKARKRASRQATVQNGPDDLEDLTGIDARPDLLGTGEVLRRRLGNQTGDLPGDHAAHLPGRQRVYVETHGCQHNQSDGEYMMGQLQDYGYTLVESVEQCDVCVLNSCTVKTPSEARGLNIVSQARKAGKQVVLAGCIPSGDKSLANKLSDVSMLHVSQLDRIVDVVEEAVKGNTVTLLDRRKDLPSLALPRVRKDKLSEIITINAGCLGNCTYCKTKFARGTVVSYPIEAIVARAQVAAAQGVRHIELASEDMGAYGVDIGTNIAELLLKLSDALPPGVMLRTGMTNPPYILQHLDGVIEALQRPNVYAFMHIPVQSGSDVVLRAMLREYTVAQFSYLVDRLKAAIPDIYILTDIICGFPHESDEDWAETMALVTKYRFPGVYSSRFFARQGTPAVKMRQLSPHIIKARYQELVEFTQTLDDKNGGLHGRETRVWYTSSDPARNQSVGRTKNYAKVVVERNDALIGRSAMTRVTQVTVKHVEGTVIGEIC